MIGPLIAWYLGARDRGGVAATARGLSAGRRFPPPRRNVPEPASRPSVRGAGGLTTAKVEETTADPESPYRTNPSCTMSVDPLRIHEFTHAHAGRPLSPSFYSTIRTDVRIYVSPKQSE